ncbi:UNVERIFIED_CONTAM: hypothetical protein PYX00_010783 [Menopon gallinae]|uniref:Uncharacterized protein n=1 Tax=Menopon gallinae TaxID=328185 RepID=A0AAW2HGX8_9NEOP
MNALVVTLMLFAATCAGPLPGRFDDQVSQPATVQKSWIDDFAKVFQGNSQGSKSPEKATTGPQVLDFKYGYELLQGLLAKMLSPKPIVDGLQEKDKYGNDGSKHQAIGEAVVRGSETLSKMINAAFEQVPKLAAKMVSNSITQALNGLGAKLIGL